MGPPLNSMRSQSLRATGMGVPVGFGDDVAVEVGAGGGVDMGVGDDTGVGDPAPVLQAEEIAASKLSASNILMLCLIVKWLCASIVAPPPSAREVAM